MHVWPGQIAIALSLAGRRPMSLERMRALRDRRVRALVSHAYERVPYYRRLLDANGTRPEHVRTAADLGLIPVTTKDGLRSAPLRDLLARGVEPAALEVIRTSGSSGEPFATYRTAFEIRIATAFFLRAMLWVGLRVTDRRARLADVPGRAGPNRGLLRRMLTSIGAGRLLDLNCLRPPREILDALRHYRPQFLHGYSSALAHVAAAATKEDRRAIRPRVVMAGGDALSAEMRRRIRVAFGAPVYSGYGSQELGLIAWECDRSRELHTCDDGVVVEVLVDGRPAEPGERGELVGTSLCFYAMPFIRYRLGDIVTAGTNRCPCGRPFGTVGEVAGRTTDHLPLPGGRWLHPYRITDVILAEADWVRRHQVVQEAPDAVSLHVVPVERPTDVEVRRVETAVRNTLPADVAFRIVMVDDIARGPGGKYRMARPLRSAEPMAEGG